MPRYDYACPQCGHENHDIVVPNWNDATRTFMLYCSKCNEAGLRVPMERKPSAPNFSIGGFNAKNGYGLR